MYSDDVLSGNWRRRKVVPEVDAERDLVVEDVDSGFCGAVVGFELGAVVLEDRHGRRRNFPLEPAAFLLDGAVVARAGHPRPAGTAHDRVRLGGGPRGARPGRQGEPDLGRGHPRRRPGGTDLG
jgi:hypothetical protein